MVAILRCGSTAKPTDMSYGSRHIGWDGGPRDITPCSRFNETLVGEVENIATGIRSSIKVT